MTVTRIVAINWKAGNFLDCKLFIYNLFLKLVQVVFEYRESLST